MSIYFNQNYPDSAALKRRAKQRMPDFAFDYLEGGCNEEIGVKRNRQDIQELQLRSNLLKPAPPVDLSVDLFGHRYAAPFGIAPVGLQGLMWPKCPEILAKAAAEANIPFVLSTVSSASLENIAEISEGKAWFQLYNPTDDSIRKDLLQRIHAARYPVLVVTVDVPTFGFRPRDIRNRLSMPPAITVKNMLQMLSKPRWLLETALAGEPVMQTLTPYMPKKMPKDGLADFMNKTVMGPVHIEGLKPIRDSWQGPLVVKGLNNPADVELAIQLGADAVIVSNHGGRQLDNGESSINALPEIARQYGDKIKVMMDSGLRTGPDIAAALASGAACTFLGRTFVYGVGALGDKGGEHTINSLRMQLEQVMRQLGCGKPSDLYQYLVAQNNSIHETVQETRYE